MPRRESAKLVEIVEGDIQSRLEKGEILPEAKNEVWFAETVTTKEEEKRALMAREGEGSQHPSPVFITLPRTAAWVD